MVNVEVVLAIIVQFVPSVEDSHCTTDPDWPVSVIWLPLPKQISAGVATALPPTGGLSTVIVTVLVLAGQDGPPVIVHWN
jgi:hypothetical protein